MTSYPHTIANGAGEELTFLRRVNGPDGGDRLEIENRVKPGSGPPMHVHYRQEEGLTVKKGRLGYQLLGDIPRFAEVGETVTFKPGEMHRFWNAGEEDLCCSGYITPADNIEFFLTAMYDSMKRNGGTQPETFEGAYLTSRYRSEFAVIDIPEFVQRYIFPVQIAIGTVLGKYRKYRNAPAPVRG